MIVTPNLIFTVQSRQNVIVALDKDTYISKVNDMLRDVNTYEKVNKDSTRKISNNFRDLFTRWKDHEYITSKYKYLNINDYFLSDVLPKVHGIVPSELLFFR